MRYLIVLGLAAAVSGMSACATWDKLDKTEKGAVIGGGSGALLGGAPGGQDALHRHRARLRFQPAWHWRGAHPARICAARRKLVRLQRGG